MRKSEDPRDLSGDWALPQKEPFSVPKPSTTAMCCEGCVYGGEHAEWCREGKLIRKDTMPENEDANETPVVQPTWNP